MAKKVAKKVVSVPKAATKPATKQVASKRVPSVKTKVTNPKVSNPSGPGANGSDKGTKASPWTLKTPSGQSEFVAYRDPTLDPPALVVVVGKTELRYALRCIEDLHGMLKQRGDWMVGRGRRQAKRK